MSAHISEGRIIEVTHVGPSLDARGGISSVLNSLSDGGDFPGYRVRFAATADQTSGPRAWIVSTVKACAISVACLTRPRGVYHLHVASKGSFYRKTLVFSAARLRGHRIVVHLHGARFHLFASESGPMTRALIRWVFGRADAVLVLSPEWRERVEEFSGRTEAVVVPNPVRVPPAPTTGDADEVLFLGRLGPRKGVPELLEAARLLQERGNTSTRWIVAGDGDVEAYRDLIAEFVRPEAVSFPGWLSHQDVEAELRRCRIFCLPSYDEGKPVALLEAMAYGLACVVTPVGGVPDVVADDVNGLLVAPGDVSMLADALERCIDDAELRIRLGARARSTVQETYSVERVSAALVAVYDRLVR